MTDPGITIRPYRPGDEAAMATLFPRAVTQIAGRHYTAEQTAAWAARGPDAAATARRAADGRWTFVAVTADGAVVGYVDLERDGHLDHLYCAPEVAGTGVARAMVEAVERCARTNGITRIHVEASEPARRLLERCGYRFVRRNDLLLDGVAIHNDAMVRALSEPANEPGDEPGDSGDRGDPGPLA